MRKRAYYIVTIGCQMNKSDSERLTGYLDECGLKPVKERKRAGLVVINTCGVRQSAEDRVYGLVKSIREENPKVKLAITGCLALREDVRAKLGQWVDLWIPINQISNFQFLISKQIQNQKSKIQKGFEIRNSKFEIQNQTECNYLNLKPKYNTSITAFIPIGNGCNNFCSYCVVPYARGREVWRPVSDILNEVRDLVAKGYKEITLIAQNVNSYVSKAREENKAGSSRRPGLRAGTPQDDRAVNFSKLLSMVNDIPGDFWIRFATSHPKDMSGELIRTIAECDKVCEHVHLPVQAGDNTVLKNMNRKYTVYKYKNLVKNIRNNFQFSIFNFQSISNNKFSIFQKRLPVAITTDVIVGFPGETRKQFENTKKLFREISFDQAFIAEYSPRPGTAAAKMADNVIREEKRRRLLELEKIVGKTSLTNNKKYLGRTVEILIKGKGRHGEFFGETRTAKKVMINKIKNSLKIIPGDFKQVRISEARAFGLRGETIG